MLIIILSFWAFSLTFLSDISLYFFHRFFWNQNRLGFKNILEIKLLDQSIVSKKGWRETKEADVSIFVKYWRSIFFIPWCKTLLTSKTVSYLLLTCPADTTNWPLQVPENTFTRRFCLRELSTPIFQGQN